MASVLDKKTLFYVTCIPFFAFFFLFDAIIYPNRHSIQPSVDRVQSLLKISSTESGASSVFAKLFANWTSALFYVVAEVYSSVSVGILFWQYANDVVSVSQAKRFYPLFAQMSGIAPILAGQYVVRYASHARDFEESLHRLTYLITFAGAMICFFYKLANDFIEQTEKSSGSSVESKDKVEKKKKAKMTMSDSARFLASSEYLRLIAVLVLGYGEDTRALKVLQFISSLILLYTSFSGMYLQDFRLILQILCGNPLLKNNIPMRLSTNVSWAILVQSLALVLALLFS